MHLELYDFWLGHVCLNNFLMLKSLTFKFHLKILSLSRSLAGGVVHLVRHNWNGKLFPLKVYIACEFIVLHMVMLCTNGLLKCPCVTHMWSCPTSEKEKNIHHFINSRSNSYYHQLVLVVNLFWVYECSTSSPPYLGCPDPFSKFYHGS